MKNSCILRKTHTKSMTKIYHSQGLLYKTKNTVQQVDICLPRRLTLAGRYNHKRSRQITTRDDAQSPKSNFIFDVRRVEFIFSQTAPVVCLPCKQTDFITRIIALFRVLLYRVSSKKLLKIENTRSNQLEPEFSFSFDPLTLP